ncbi:MAG: helix-turn-helix transcriptional regulator [Pseudomonadota bacterium]
MTRNVLPQLYPMGDPRTPSRERPVRLVARELDADDLLREHQHGWGQVTYAHSGVLRVTTSNSSWIVPPLRAIWIAPDVRHEVTVLEKASMRVLWVDAPRRPFADDECKVLEVSGLLRELIVALEQAVPGAREAMLSELILDELAHSPTQAIRVPLPRDKRLVMLCNALLANPSGNQTLAQWAGAVGASERTLARLFEADLGMSFTLWRQQARLAHAAPLIVGGMPLSLVAQTLGYASQSAFSAMFKKTFGSPPSSLLRNAKPGAVQA